jgi:hypothetical protein
MRTSSFKCHILHVFKEKNVSLIQYTVKIGKGFSRPSRDITCQISLAGKNLIIPARESLLSDIPAGDGKTANLFFTVYV